MLTHYRYPGRVVAPSPLFARPLFGSPLFAGRIFLSLLLFSLVGCNGRVLPPDNSLKLPFTADTVALTTVDYQQHIDPILEQKCLACHGCYDAPCQLKLSSASGLARGVTKQPVYNGTRLDPMQPTRLDIDAQTPQQWRDLGFLPALTSHWTEYPRDNARPIDRLQESLLYRMVELGHRNKLPANSKLPDDIQTGTGRGDECPLPDNYAKFAAGHPHRGMPLGVTGLSDTEFSLLQNWVAQGSELKGRDAGETTADSQARERWEHWLNRPDKKQQLVARYLFEHWFAAHLHFVKEQQPEREPLFYQILRSRTPPGEPLVPVATVRPNEDPQGRFYYRLQAITSSLVAKTHITYSLAGNRMAQLEALFFGQPWQVTALPGYSDANQANPFITFAAIPAAARYQYLLNDAEYFVRTFIRGPVCRGQIAVNVIEDQFWAWFQKPANDQYITDADYRQQVAPLLALPGQNDKITAVANDFIQYRQLRNQYLQKRQQHYASVQPQGARYIDLWDGDGHNRDAMLTIFRHFDNATVRRGLIGPIPETMWVMDYPLLERTYYHLVANFNIFGNVSHQAQTRLYFDLIRHGGEMNFLRFMPAGSRRSLQESWYGGAAGRARLKYDYPKVDDSTPSGINFSSQAPKQEFAEKIRRHLSAIAGPDDPINRPDEPCLQNCGETPSNITRQLRRLANIEATDLPVARLLPEMTYLRIGEVGGVRQHMYSIARNSAHSTVAFMFAEDARRQPEQDTLQMWPQILGLYPNFMFNVSETELPTFVNRMVKVKNSADLDAVVEQFGVRRTHPQFWPLFHDISAALTESAPLQRGVFDMNRYENY